MTLVGLMRDIFLKSTKGIETALNDIDQVIPEVMDLDESELDELVAYAKKNLIWMMMRQKKK